MTLTPRQEQVAECVSRGLTNSDIAAELGISENTVKNQIWQIVARLGLHGSRQKTLVFIWYWQREERR